MKKIIVSILVLVFTLSFVEDAQAQRRGTKKRKSREESTETDSRRDRNDEYSRGIMDKLNFEIKPGNLFIGNTTSLSVKANAGYKFTNSISAGLGGKYFYLWGSGIGGRSDYGAFAYARAKVSQEIYLVAEYNTMSLGNFNSDVRGSVNYPAAGFGYIRPGLDWSSGFELLFVFSEDARNALQIPLEYWFNFSYNF